MKTPLLYGALMAIIGGLLTFGLFFAGYHDSAEKFETAGRIGMVVGLIASVTLMALAMRDRRAEFPGERPWGYGAALGTGVLTGMWAALFGAVVAYVYLALVNPQFSETAFQAQVAKMQAKGMSAAQIDAASGFMRKVMSPAVMTLFQTIYGFVASVVLALIIAIFFRKRATPVQEGELASPPTLG